MLRLVSFLFCTLLFISCISHEYKSRTKKYKLNKKVSFKQTGIVNSSVLLMGNDTEFYFDINDYLTEFEEYISNNTGEVDYDDQVLIDSIKSVLKTRDTYIYTDSRTGYNFLNRYLVKQLKQKNLIVFDNKKELNIIKIKKTWEKSGCRYGYAYSTEEEQLIIFEVIITCPF